MQITRNNYDPNSVSQADHTLRHDKQSGNTTALATDTQNLANAISSDSALSQSKRDQLMGQAQNLSALAQDPTQGNSDQFSAELAQLEAALEQAGVLSPTSERTPHGFTHSGDSYTPAQNVVSTQSIAATASTPAEVIEYVNGGSGSGNGSSGVTPTSSTGSGNSTFSTSSAAAVPQAGTESLYPNGSPQPSDVQQGATGDCDFVAQLASLAARDPSQITNMISSDGAGGYNVKLYNNGQPQTVNVSAANLDTTALSHAAGQQGGKADWTTIVEAAADKMTGGNMAGIGGTTAQGMLTGKTGDYEQTSSLGGTAGIGQKISSTLAAGGLIDAFGNGGTTSNGQQIVGDHAYAVVGMSGDQVTLQNPWYDEDPNKGTNGKITMSLEDFARIFPNMEQN